MLDVSKPTRVQKQNLYFSFLATPGCTTLFASSCNFYLFILFVKHSMIFSCCGLFSFPVDKLFHFRHSANPVGCIFHMENSLAWMSPASCNKKLFCYGTANEGYAAEKNKKCWGLFNKIKIRGKTSAPTTYFILKAYSVHSLLLCRTR